MDKVSIPSVNRIAGRQSIKMDNLDVFNGIELKRERRLSVEIYEVLRLLIIKTALHPGQFISEVDVGNMLGVSRTPVREAFLNLARDGFVEIFPQSHMKVSKISAKDLEQAMFIRETMELASIPLVVKNISENCIVNLENINKRIRSTIRDDDYVGFIENDDLFHRTLIESSGYDLVVDIVRQVGGRLDRLRYITSAMPGAAELSAQDHDDLISALRDKNVVACEEVLRGHLQRSWEKLKRAIQTHGS
jgi:DNA-binding GntR family transcriptional regulator|tara:strand:- start:548 stop:1291 length:744 start_codon:yes stop_codon:yes gene_type:complete